MKGLTLRRASKGLSMLPILPWSSVITLRTPWVLPWPAMCPFVTSRTALAKLADIVGSISLARHKRRVEEGQNMTRAWKSASCSADESATCRPINSSDGSAQGGVEFTSLD